VCGVAAADQKSSAHSLSYLRIIIMKYFAVFALLGLLAANAAADKEEEQTGERLFGLTRAKGRDLFVLLRLWRKKGVENRPPLPLAGEDH